MWWWVGAGERASAASTLAPASMRVCSTSRRPFHAAHISAAAGGYVSQGAKCCGLRGTEQQRRTGEAFEVVLRDGGLQRRARGQQLLHLLQLPPLRRVPQPAPASADAQRQAAEQRGAWGGERKTSERVGGGLLAGVVRAGEHGRLGEQQRPAGEQQPHPAQRRVARSPTQ